MNRFFLAILFKKLYSVYVTARNILVVWIGMLTSLLVVLLIVNYFHIAFPLYIQTSQVSSELSVVGDGKVDVKPDTAQVSAGLTVSNAATVADAQTQIDMVSNKLVSSLASFGIQKKDIQTSNYSINPSFPIGIVGPQPALAPNIGVSSPSSKQTSYSADVTYTVTVRDITKLAQITTAITAAGANQINNVNYSIDNPEKYREQARNNAISNARDQAQKLASQLGIRLGRVTNIVEGSNPPDPVPLMANSFAKGISSNGVPQPDLQPGTQTVISEVTLYFEKD